MTSSGKGPGWEGRAKNILRLTGLACLCWLLYRFDYRAVVGAWREISWGVGLAFIGLMPVVIACKFFRWHILLGLAGYRPSPLQSLFIYNQGNFWGLVSPGKLGEFVRCTRLKDELGCPLLRGAGLIVLDRLFDLFSLAGCFILGFSAIMWGAGAGIFLAALFLAAAASLGGFMLPRAADWLAGRTGKDAKEAKRLFAKVKGGAGLAAAALSLSAMAVMIARAWILADYGYGLSLSGLETAFIIAAFNLSMLLPLSIWGLGTNEALLVFLAAAFWHGGQEPARLVAFSLSFTLLAYLPAVALGGVLYLIDLARQKTAPGRSRPRQ